MTTTLMDKTAGRMLAKPYVLIVIIYLVSRVITAPMWYYGWRAEKGFGFHGESFLYYLGWLWDGEWYGIIATEGYPEKLPRDATTGEVLQNAWEFLPLFPLLGKAIMSLTALPWEVVGPSLSIILGLVATIFLYKLLLLSAPELCQERPWFPILAVVALSFYPSAGVFTLAYAESLALVFIFAALISIRQRRYVLASISVILLGLARPVALPFAAVTIWHGIQRFRQGQADRASRPTRREWMQISALAIISAASGLVWPVIVGVFTGVPDGFFQTQAAWRHGVSSTIPFAGWVGQFESQLGLFLVFALVVFSLAWFFTPRAIQLGEEIRSWALAYAVFMLATTSLNSGVFRYSLLIVALPIAMTRWVRRPWMFVFAVLVLSVGQALWVAMILLRPEGMPP